MVSITMITFLAKYDGSASILLHLWGEIEYKRSESSELRFPLVTFHLNHN